MAMVVSMASIGNLENIVAVLEGFGLWNGKRYGVFFLVLRCVVA
jgi:uncharacterized membrane protein (DUF2068 family)